MLTRVSLCCLWTSLALTAQSTEVVRRQIEDAYEKSVEALRKSKTIEDLDEINRSFDTRDWQSIVPGRVPWSWNDLRKYPLETLIAPFDSMTLQIETFEVKGDTAMLAGNLRVVNKGSVSLVPLKETWVKTVVGWKRKIHEKLGPPVRENPAR